ncbi:bifunctional diguanylate cyclase/phosphodiesterase [Phyllobacterium myrsinacearum]|uniref:Diguanylate cyclase (GGDEF)-like protein n=1 Tax=Phyllobacterium myrsinacearum TaxID=28101 RepID=A0A839EG68_9HYPH|nr:EAL domain-containing protein [Phyllobacterium myrsinacearum]MBA8877378.1 diguanylate cyclase (GGDEF)-like protein [Phyllobacterium myrsinacearum]
MLTVYNCIVNEHDVRLVFLAAAICIFSCLTAVDLLRHARHSPHQTIWLCVSAASCGFGIWATHFIAMMAFSPGLPNGYNGLQTILSLLIAIAVTGLGAYTAITAKWQNADLAGGAIMGVGIAAMHFTGMLAFEVEGRITWDPTFVAVAIGVGVILGAFALRLALSPAEDKTRHAAAGLLTLAICGHHFIAMSAVSITPDSSILISDNAIPANFVAVTVALVSTLILVASSIALTIDVRNRRYRLELQRMHKLVNAAVEGLVICDGETIVTANESFCTLANMDNSKLTGGSIAAFLPDARLRAKLLSDQNELVETTLTGENGDPIPVELIAHTIDFNGKWHRAVAVRDLRSRKEAEAHINYLAHHDALTGLPNRRNFNARLDQLIATATGDDEAYLALFCLDLDRFKEVNDLFGHAAGDDILQRVSSAITKLLGKDETLARLGGDEFAIIVPGLVTPTAASRLADKILEALQSENLNSPIGFLISTSIGIAIFPVDAGDRETLLNQADTALYQAKAEGRNTYRFFEAKMGAEARERRMIEHDLRNALPRNELRLVYQPQMRMDTGAVTGFEALMRWHNPRLGEISPTVFIPIAEESGVILQLGEWALREACREAASWEKPLSIAVNVSAVQLYSHDFPQRVHSALLHTGLPAHRLELEITETALIKDTNRALTTLRQLKALGVRIAMDDFGTGYSSLSNVRAFPFDMIKIDRSFIKSVDKNEQAAAIVKAVLGLGRGLGMPVLAEGIETPDELEFLMGESCSAGQGFYLGMPSPMESFRHLISDDAPSTAKKLIAL